MTRTVDQVLSGVDLTGKICVITGATSGLGLMTAQWLASAGATVVLAGRDPERLRSAAEAITTETATAAIETVERSWTVWQVCVRPLSRSAQGSRASTSLSTMRA